MDKGKYPEVDHDFSNAPICNFNDGQVKFDTNRVDDVNANYGSVSFLLPKSLLFSKGIQVGCSLFF
jgi:hypothetical protein